ncbi:hypothetical protein ACJIZ3_002002 [Penstemon smallii]|uniref:Uncharacterized protein n=1 Tax=Penstemon smallii TaxID=265156 RepID=A0ABD3U585_9LAMI
MGSEHGNVSNINHVEIKHEDGKPLLEPNSPHFSSPSSSSSSSSSALEFDTNEKSQPLNDSSTKPEIDENLSSGPESVSSPDNTAPTTPQWSMVSASPLSSSFGPSPEVSSSQMKSPQAQTMARPTGYDPNRIPASVFSTKQSNLTDWSTASNESLFSIHMGNNSFSREHSTWLEEWNNGQTNTPHGTESKSTELSLPPVMEVPGHEESSVKSGKEKLEKEDCDKNLKVGSMENNAKEKIAPVEIVPTANGPGGFKGSPAAEANRTSSSSHRTSYSNPRLSDESGNSSSSFAFPVLVSDGAKGGSSKMVIEKPPEKPAEKVQPEAQVYEATPKPSETRWFSCIPWWPRCC